MRRNALLASAAIAIAAIAISACSSSSGDNGMGGGMGNGHSSSGHHSSQNQNTPRKAGQFRLTEWNITADSQQLPSGSQTLTALNTGNHTHELVIVRATDAASLPTKPDGSVDENALKTKKVGEIADVAAGSSKHATFDLAPGNYVAFCNITDSMGMGGMDHNHFELGMHTTFTVNAA
jgi:plastocyanin